MLKNVRSAHILLVEDNPTINHSLTRSIQRSFRIDSVGTVSGACQYLAEQETPYDVIVLDRNLPDGDGLEVLPMVDPQTKICVISQRTKIPEQVHSLRKGVDAYLPKPITPVQVHEHINALLRRSKIQQTHKIEWFGLNYYPEDRRLVVGKEQTRLTQREGQFFLAFLQTTHGRVTHQKLHESLWQDGTEPSCSVIHVTIQRLRKKLKPLHITIQGVYGLGYQLIIPQFFT